MEGLIQGCAPLEELAIFDNPMTQTSAAVSKWKLEQARSVAEELS